MITGFSRFCAIRATNADASIGIYSHYARAFGARRQFLPCPDEGEPVWVALFCGIQAATLINYCESGALLYPGCPPRLMSVKVATLDEDLRVPFRLTQEEMGVSSHLHRDGFRLRIDTGELARLAPESILWATGHTGAAYISFHVEKWPEGWSKRPGVVPMGEIVRQF